TQHVARAGRRDRLSPVVELETVTADGHPGFVESEAGRSGIEATPAELVEQSVRGGVAADRDHQPQRGVNRDPIAGLETGTVVLNQIGGIDSNLMVETDLTLLSSPVRLIEDDHLVE